MYANYALILLFNNNNNNNNNNNKLSVSKRYIASSHNPQAQEGQGVHYVLSLSNMWPEPLEYGQLPRD